MRTGRESSQPRCARSRTLEALLLAGVIGYRQERRAAPFASVLEGSTARADVASWIAGPRTMRPC
jgi:hypothetical protein